MHGEKGEAADLLALQTAIEEMSGEIECNDTPDELLAPEAKRLGLLAESCADLLFLGGCEFNVVKDLCPKSCRACIGSGEDRHRERRQMKVWC